MLVFSFEVTKHPSRGPVILVLVLEKENLDRMREGDPFDIQLSTYAPHLNANRPIRDLDIMIAYEEDLNTIIGFRERKDMAGLMQWLERGRRHRPGDAQRPVPLRRT